MLCARTPGVRALAAAMFLAGCIGEAIPSRGDLTPIVRMSEALDHGARLSYDSAALVVLGGLRADPEDEFNHRNGFLFGTELSDGSFAVIDEHRVRIIARDNTQRTVFGKSGRGPRESLGFSAVCATRGDTLVAYDIFLRRISVLTGKGELVRQFAVRDIDQL